MGGNTATVRIITRSLYYQMGISSSYFKRKQLIYISIEQLVYMSLSKTTSIRCPIHIVLAFLDNSPEPPHIK